MIGIHREEAARTLLRGGARRPSVNAEAERRILLDESSEEFRVQARQFRRLIRAPGIVLEKIERIELPRARFHFL